MYIEPKVLHDGTVLAKLNIDGLEIPNKENLEHLLLFPVSTYVKLTKIKNIPGIADRQEEGPIIDENWDITFANVNQFFNMMTTEHQVILAQGLMMMHHTIREFFTKDNDLMHLNATMRQVAIQLDDIDKEIDLCSQLKQYVTDFMNVGLYEGAGKRAQDSDILTFLPDHVRSLMAITLLCKMLCPMYGEIMAALDKRIDTKLKETHCVAMLTQLFQRRYPQLIDKLNHYIKHTVKQHNDETASGLMHGYDNNSLSYYMYTALMARQFVNVDLRVRNGNLMTYIIVSIKRAITTVHATIKKNPTYPRKPVTSKHEEDGNTAQLEIDSMTSRKTLDCTPIINAAINPSIREYMKKYDIDQESYQASLAYYQANPIVPNPINKYMNAMFFGPKLGGGQGLLMLHGTEYTKLTTLLQLIIFSLDTNYVELGHMMSARVADTAIDTTINAGTFKVRVGSSQSYRAVKQMFDSNPYGIRGKDWDQHVQKITDNLTTNKYIFNTSNFIWNYLEEDNRNGKVFAPTDATITAMCSMYDFIMHTEGSL